MDYGLSEFDFWSMTFAEVIRFIESRQRIELREDKRKAAFDYSLAALIGRSVSAIYSSANKFPSIEEAYPNLYSSEELEETREESKAELSSIRFKQFAEAFNKKFKQEVK